MNLRTYLMIKAAAAKTPPAQLPPLETAYDRNKYLIRRPIESPSFDRLQQLATGDLRSDPMGRRRGPIAPSGAAQRYTAPVGYGRPQSGRPMALPQAAPAVPKPAAVRPAPVKPVPRPAPVQQITPQQQQDAASQLMQGYYGTHGGMSGMFNAF